MSRTLLLSVIPTSALQLCSLQVWKNAALWEGFIRCCVKIRPQSYQVLLQLPPSPLESVFQKERELRQHLRHYVENFSAAQVGSMSSQKSAPKLELGVGLSLLLLGFALDSRDYRFSDLIASLSVCE